jgi:hypothetical protein
LANPDPIDLNAIDLNAIDLGSINFRSTFAMNRGAGCGQQASGPVTIEPIIWPMPIRLVLVWSAEERLAGIFIRRIGPFSEIVPRGSNSDKKIENF